MQLSWSLQNIYRFFMKLIKPQYKVYRQNVHCSYLREYRGLVTNIKYTKHSKHIKYTRQFHRKLLYDIIDITDTFVYPLDVDYKACLVPHFKIRKNVSVRNVFKRAPGGHVTFNFWKAKHLEKIKTKLFFSWLGKKQCLKIIIYNFLNSTMKQLEP